MDLSDFDFKLPEHLIAQIPPKQRDGGKLLDVNNNNRILPIKQLADLLLPNDLVVINESRVVPARLFGMKLTGGRIEILLERFLSDCRFIAQIRSSKSLKCPSTINSDAGDFIVECKQDSFYQLMAVSKQGVAVNAKRRFQRAGHVPLPPYIHRADCEADKERYQTVYARTLGSVAAPTAGLHITEELLGQIEATGATIARLTLHVGAGTFSPIRDSLDTHIMHDEAYCISQKTARAINEAKARGRRIVAIGTTVLRALESAGMAATITAGNAKTNLFIQPGFKFKMVDCLFTNFHLPRSSLFVLVCAFAGTACIQRAYKEAIEQQMRFYSYGDAMFLNHD